jgi:hypothetical protein
VNTVRTPDLPWPGRLPQHVQTGRVVDLAVDENDPRDRRIARGTAGLQDRIGVDLGQNVRRGVDQRPGGLGAAGSHPCADRQGGLGAGTSPQSAPAHAGAVAAIAVPLREAAARGGPQNPYLQRFRFQPGAARARRGLARRGVLTAAGLVLQRLAMYIVISMPKRKSIASGVSHFILDS